MAAKLKERMSKYYHLFFSVNGSKTNSAATPSEENQKDEVLNNQFEKLNSYSAKEKKQSKYR